MHFNSCNIYENEAIAGGVIFHWGLEVSFCHCDIHDNR